MYHVINYANYAEEAVIEEFYTDDIYEVEEYVNEHEEEAREGYISFKIIDV